MSYNGAQLFELSKKVGRSWRTLQYWAAQGCDLNDPQLLQRFTAAAVGAVRNMLCCAWNNKEEESFRRLRTALQGGDQFEIDACQTYWLKVAETRRRLDVSIDLARRQAETRIPLHQAEDVVTYVSELLRRESPL